MDRAIPCHIYRGGTSKGLFFLADDLPAESAARDQLLLSVMGSPDMRQIDGMGGGHPLTSKVAVVHKSTREGIDVDYLFLQVAVDKAEVSTSQNCGNLLAAVGPFAIEKGLLDAEEEFTDARIHMDNTGATAVARVQTPNRTVNYAGDTRIDGVPGSAAPISIQFENVQGSSCGELLPCGLKNTIDGIDVTCIDNGMPVVVMDASDFGLSGSETPKELEANAELKKAVEAIRLRLAKQMNLGDVSDKTTPKMCLISAPVNGGLVNTRTFIPHRVHEAIGVLGAVSVATACLIPGTVGYEVANGAVQQGDNNQYDIEHPTGAFTVEIDLYPTEPSQPKIKRAALIRTARLLMRGDVIAPATFR